MKLSHCTSSRSARAASALATAVLAACSTPGGGTGKPVIPVNPECTIHVVDFAVNPKADVAVVADRSDPTVNTGFTHFRRLGGPIGNSSVGFTSDVYGFNEAWLSNSATVFRAQAHPRKRSQFNDFKASAWSVTAEDVSGTWSTPFAAGSANKGLQEEDDPVAGGVTVPQLMPVGYATQQMFACAGTRSDDSAVRTTALFEFTAPNAASGTHGGSMFIQDLLSGDDRFVPNAPGPLIGPANPPTPHVHGPGSPVDQGAVQCAMLQSGDDLSTRELHMLVLNNGKLYHAMASNWSTAVDGNGTAFQRFNTVSPWGDVGQALGGGFGNIVSAAIVASRPQAVSVLFGVQTSSGAFKLMHAVRSSIGGGSWRAPDDVLALNGATSTGPSSGWGKQFQIAAGMCPEYQPAMATQDQELLYVLWTADRDIMMGRHVSTARQWSPQFNGNYSPLFNISTLLAGTSDASRMDTINSMSVGSRPFRDDATAGP